METKICTGCQKEKQVDQFNWKRKSDGIRHVRCSDCTKKSVSSHYSRNKVIYKQRARAFAKIQKTQNRNNLFLYLSDKKCVDCGENDPVVLQLDHVRDLKKDNVSYMVQRCYSWATIEKEIQKCEIRCANCHCRKTAKQFGWSKLKK